jgi:putative ABC transport system substrate-binding protein
LQDLGWTDGRNVRFDYRWGSGDRDRILADATHLIGLEPSVILANSTIVATVLKQATQSIPIVFVQVADPVRDGIVASLARPGGNVTGFTSFEYTMGGKWLETLKELAPSATKVALMHHPDDPNWPGFLRAIEQVAPSFDVQLAAAGVRNVLPYAAQKSHLRDERGIPLANCSCGASGRPVDCFEGHGTVLKASPQGGS